MGLEERAEMLAARLEKRAGVLKDRLTPRPFTKRMPRAEALAWWQQHRYDDIGQAEIANMNMSDVVSLDLALSQANEAEQNAGLPVMEE